MSGPPRGRARAGRPDRLIHPDRPDHHVLLDAEDDDWRWRRRIRADPRLRGPYRVAVFLVGLVVTVGGLLLVPLPGPGWVIVFIGVAIWASEFERAQRLLEWGKRVLERWTAWVKAQSLVVQGLVVVLTAAFVAAVVWAVVKVSGLPGFVPDGVGSWLHANLWL